MDAPGRMSPARWPNSTPLQVRHDIARVRRPARITVGGLESESQILHVGYREPRRTRPPPGWGERHELANRDHPQVGPSQHRHDDRNHAPEGQASKQTHDVKTS